MIVSTEDYLCAYACFVMEMPSNIDVGALFMKYLGCTSFVYIESGYEMPEEAARKIRLLTGPHYKTIIAAWRSVHYES